MANLVKSCMSMTVIIDMSYMSYFFNDCHHWYVMHVLFILKLSTLVCHICLIHSTTVIIGMSYMSYFFNDCHHWYVIHVLLKNCQHWYVIYVLFIQRLSSLVCHTCLISSMTVSIGMSYMSYSFNDCHHWYVMHVIFLQ